MVRTMAGEAGTGKGRRTSKGPRMNKTVSKSCLRAWLNGNTMFYETFVCFYVSEAKPLCFSLCSQMFDGVERCLIYNIQNVCHADEQLSLC